MKTRNRLLSGLLAFTLCFGLLSPAALAVGTEEPGEPEGASSGITLKYDETAGDYGRVWLDVASNDVVVDSFEFNVTSDNYEIDDYGYIVLKQGKTAAEENLSISAAVKYFDGEAVIFADNVIDTTKVFDTKTNAGYKSNYDYKISDTSQVAEGMTEKPGQVARTGRYGITTAIATGTNADSLYGGAPGKDLGSAVTGTLTAWYYDPVETGKELAESPETQLGMHIDIAQSNDSPNRYFMGIAALSGNTNCNTSYYYRATDKSGSGNGTWTDSGITRSEGWHKMQWIVDGTSGLTMTWDGEQVYTDANLKSLQYIHIANNKGNNQATADLLEDRHFIDDISVVAAGATAKDLTPTVTVKVGTAVQPPDEPEKVELTAKLTGVENNALASASDVGRVRLDTTGKTVAVDSITYSVSDEDKAKVTLDEKTGEIKWKDGYTPAADETVTVTVNYSYYSGSGVKYVENFDDNTAKPFTNTNYAINDGQSRTGSYGVTASGTTPNSAATATVGPFDNVRVTAWYYDPCTPEDLSCTATMKFGFAATHDTGTVNTNQLGVFFGTGDGDGSITNYAYRIATSGNFTGSSVVRSAGWHKLEWVVTAENGTVMSIDGTQVATEATRKQVANLTLATNWVAQNANDQAGMNLVRNHHYIDDISIVDANAKPQTGTATVAVNLKAPAGPKPFAAKLTFGQGGADETLVKGESGRVYLDDIGDYAIAGVTYTTDNANVEVDSTGNLTVKEGYTPGENETVKVTAQVTYYDPADVIFSDSFEGDKQFGTPNVYAHSTANPLFGRYAATPQGSTNGYPAKTLDPVSDVTVTAWYYDNYADHGEGDDQLKFGFSVSGNGNAMGVFYDKTIAALVGNNTKDHYGMRVSGTQYDAYSWGGSNVARSKGWHKFEWVIDSTKGMTTYIDGQVVSTHQGTVGGSTVPELTPVQDNANVKELTDIRLAEGWNNNAQNLGYIADKHFIDGVTVVKTGASTQTQTLETTVKVTNPEPPKPVEDLTLDVAVAEGLRKGEQQRVYVTGANTEDRKVIIDKVKYSVSGTGADKVDIDPDTGVLTVKKGVAPAADDKVTVTAEVTYYKPEVGDILWMEDMEHKGDGNLIASDGKTYCLAHSGNSDVTGLAASRTGKLAGTTQSTVKDGTFSTQINQTGTLVFWYYDTATEEELTGTYDSQAKFGMMVNNYQPFFIGVAVPTVSSEYGGGGYEDYTPYRDVYGYRLNGTWYPSNIKRSTGWHKFEVSVTGEGTKAFIDGQPVCKLGETTPVVNDAVKTIEKVIITTNWGNQGSNGKFVNNKHFIDDIYVLAEGKTLGTAQTKTLTYEDMPVLDIQYTTTPATVTVENSAYPKDAWIQVQPSLEELASVKVDGNTLDAAQWHVTTAEDAPQNASYYPVGELIVYADAFKNLSAGAHKLVLVMTSGSEHEVPVTVAKNEAHTATSYYLSNKGDDSNDGHSEAQAWASFDKLSTVEFGPGDHIYLDATSVWSNVQFQPKGSGAKGAPIVLTKYNDSGDSSRRPILNGDGTVAKKDTSKGEHSYLAFDAWRKFYPSGTIELFNVEYWEVRGIEITNYAPTYEQTGTGRNGIAIIHDFLEIQGIKEMPGYNSTLEEAFYRAGKLQHVIVNDCYIHDVTGYHPGSGASGAGGKMSGGINAYGPYDDLKLDNNIIMYCDVEGIRNDVLAWRGDTRTQFPCYMEGVSISNNFIVGVPGDGVVISSAMEPKLAHNYLTDAGYSYFVPNAGAVASGTAPKAMGNRQNPIIVNNSTNFAGLWFIGTMDAVAEYNESVNNVWTCNDGEAFDADMFTWGTVFQYNYTYKNNGGMCLFMSGNQMDDGTLVRYNVSVMDGEGVGTPNDGRKATFHYNKEPDAIYNNLFILGDGVRGMFGGDSCTAYFYNNMVIKPDGEIGSFNLNTTSNSNAAAKAMTSKTQLNNNLFYPAAILDNVTGGITKENNITPESLDGIFADLDGFLAKQPVQALAGRSALTGSAATGAGAAQVMSVEEGRSVKTPNGTGFDYAQFEGIKTVEGSPTIGAGVSVQLTIWPQTDTVHPLTKDFFQNSITGKGIDIGPYNWTADANHYVKLTLEDNGADVPVAPLYGPIGKLVTLPTPAMTGATFAGWYENEDLTGTAITEYTITEPGTTLYAKWQRDPGKFNVTFDSQGGSEVAPSNGLDTGDKVARPAADPTKAGYRFLGWYKEAAGTTAWNFETDTVTADTTIYAKWEKLSYTVTFNENGGDTQAAPSTMTVSPPVTVLSSLPTEPTRAGYVFTGWNTKADGTGTAFTAETEVTADITVYAQWKETFTVTYDANGGTAAGPAQQVVAGGGTVGTLPTPPTRSGYVFDGWNTAQDGSGTAFTADTVVNAGITVYAQWRETEKYTVTYDANGGTASDPAQQIVAAGETVGTLPTPPTRAGYEFTGWNTAQEGSGTAFTATTRVNGSITVYAQWKTEGKLVVTYDANGGTVAADPARQEVAAGETVGTLPTPPQRDGYEFTGWNTRPGGRGEAFTAATEVTADLTVYAQWKKTETFTVTYDVNGGTLAGPAQQEVAPGGTVGTLPTPPTRSGYEFTGWNTAKDGTGTAFTAETVVNGDVTVYAQWRQLKYTVTYDANGGTAVSPAQQEVAAGETVGTLPTQPTRDGYEFTGWNTEPGGRGTVFDSNTVVEANVTVYAQWKTVGKLVVFYDANGGTVAADPARQEVAPGEAVGTLPTPPQRSGYEFTGWNTERDGSGTAFTASTVVSADLTVYAQWRQLKYTVTYDANGGTAGEPAQQVVAGGETVGTLPTPPTRDGYEFTGWNTAQDGSGTVFDGNTVVDANITVYAQWKTEGKLVVIYDANGGRLAGPARQEVAPNGTVGTLPTAPTREGYEFSGWNTAQDGSGTAFTASTVVSADLTVYAQWKQIKFTVTYDANGGTASSPAQQEVAAGEAVGTLPTAPQRSGYDFTGWNTAQDGSGTAFTASTVVSADLTVYAQWRQQSSSGGSTGGSTAVTPPVTTGKDTQDGDSSSTTTTTAKPSATVKGETASSAVSASVGSEIVKQAEQNKSDNVVIAPEITGSVTKTEVTISASTVGQIGSKTSASLTVSTPVAEVTISNEALSGLAQSGGNLTVTAEQTGTTVELSVTAGGKAVESIPGGVKVVVPAEAPKPGTVAVIVREDGSREVVRKSMAGENGVTIPLDGSAKIEIVDNSKRFEDVPAENWASDAVAFASSHELFHGTSETTFSPDLPMSRGMLAVVLHNLEGNPKQAVTGAFADVDNSKWYAEGIAWAAEKGIVTGYGSGEFGPDDDITREQLAVMLWRYAGSPTASDGALDFSDADHVSAWALEAMRWATQKGIINGMGNGVLDPTGKATRAQTAQMLKNFMENQ